MRTACYHVSALVGFSALAMTSLQSAQAFPMLDLTNTAMFESASTLEEITEAGVDFTSIVVTVVDRMLTEMYN